MHVQVSLFDERESTKEARRLMMEGGPADLFPGQMVCTPDLTLMDSMAALQIMDSRMDSGIFPIPNHLIAEGDQRPWEAVMASKPINRTRLSAEEICWVMDRLVACEVAWHKGASLSQTIHTCLYIHSLASIHPSAPLIVGQETNWLVSKVLRPFLIATLKCVGLVWDELTRGNVMDGEDYNGDKAGVSLLEDVSIQEASALLDGALAYLQTSTDAAAGNNDIRADTLSVIQATSLSSRVSLRKNMLFSIYSLARVDPAIITQDVHPIETLLEARVVLEGAQTILQSLNDTGSPAWGLMSPSFANAPSEGVTYAFDPWYSRRPAKREMYDAPSAPPPPLPLDLDTPQDIIEIYSSLLRGMCEAVDLVTIDVGWAAWKVSCCRSESVFLSSFPHLPIAPGLSGQGRSRFSTRTDAPLHSVSLAVDDLLQQRHRPAMAFELYCRGVRVRYNGRQILCPFTNPLRTGP
jgi:hypothetical protein